MNGNATHKVIYYLDIYGHFVLNAHDHLCLSAYDHVCLGNMVNLTNFSHIIIAPSEVV